VVRNSKPKLNPFFLLEFLNFLELVVLNERIIVGDYPVFKDLDPDVLKSPAAGKISNVYGLKGDLNIGQKALDRLTEQGVLYDVELYSDDVSPRDYLTRHLSLSDELQDSLHDTSVFLRKYEPDRSIADELAMAEMNWNFGVPMFLSELAREAQLPFRLTRHEMRRVAWAEKLEIRLQRGVVARLADSLNEGARKELDQLAELGGHTVFPQTPISWQIVAESNGPEDLVQVALQLRDEYRKFRRRMVELEAELADEQTSLKRKIKLKKQVDAMAGELWPTQPTGIRKEATELSGLLNALPAAVDAATLGGVTGLTQYVLSRPTDLILKLLRRRKVRVLLNSKRTFLRGANWTGKLANIFNIPQEDVREALFQAGE
jgi:antitoxin component of RelBE/YafQ-DinJ toxin-antitoxin module